MNEAVSEVLDEIVAERTLDLPRGAARIAVAEDGNVRPAISLDDNAAVRDLMDGLGPSRLEGDRRSVRGPASDTGRR